MALHGCIHPYYSLWCCPPSCISRGPAEGWGKDSCPPQQRLCVDLPCFSPASELQWLCLTSAGHGGHGCKCFQDFFFFPRELPAALSDGSSLSPCSKKEGHAQSWQGRADPLLALTEPGRMEKGIRNYLHYWQGRTESANFSRHLPGSRKSQLHRSAFSSSCRLFTFLHKFSSVLGKIYCNFPVNHVLTSLLAAPELSSDCATRAADKRSCLLQQLLSVAPSHLLNRLVQIYWRALLKTWLTPPPRPPPPHSPRITLSAPCARRWCPALLCDRFPRIPRQDAQCSHRHRDGQTQIHVLGPALSF